MASAVTGEPQSKWKACQNVPIPGNCSEMINIEDIINTVVCGDCLEVMAEMPDGCVDLVLTDPPYGIGEDGAKNHTRECLAKSRYYPPAGWDKEPPSQAHFDEMRRVGLEQIVFGANHFAHRLPESSCWIVWDKDNGATDFADCELAWASYRKAVRRFRWKSQGMLQEPGYPKEQRVHPTQKPLPLMLWILRRFGQGTSIILDPFCGSGTTCVAAKMLGRNYIGIDISSDYVAIARKRLEAVDTGVPVKERDAGQLPLFTGHDGESDGS